MKTQDNEASNQSNIIIYQAQDGELSIDVKLDNDTVWLSQAQMVEIRRNFSCPEFLDNCRRR